MNPNSPNAEDISLAGISIAVIGISASESWVQSQWYLTAVLVPSHPTVGRFVIAWCLWRKMTHLGSWYYFFGLRKVSQASDIRSAKLLPNDLPWDFCEEGLIIVSGRVGGQSGVIDIEAHRIDPTSSPP